VTDLLTTKTKKHQSPQSKPKKQKNKKNSTQSESTTVFIPTPPPNFEPFGRGFEEFANEFGAFGKADLKQFVSGFCARSDQILHPQFLKTKFSKETALRKPRTRRRKEKTRPSLFF